MRRLYLPYRRGDSGTVWGPSQMSVLLRPILATFVAGHPQTGLYVCG